MYKPVFSAISIIIKRNISSVLGKKTKKQDSESTSTCTAELCQKTKLFPTVDNAGLSIVY